MDCCPASAEEQTGVLCVANVRGQPRSGPDVVQVLVGVGSNIEPERHVLLCLRALAEDLEDLQVGPFYLTRPLGGCGNQPPYVNGVAAGMTRLTSEDLVRLLHEIEDRLGRVRDRQNADALCTIDLDLLLYGDRIDETQGLPSEELVDRDFFLVSAAHLLPDFRHPVLRRTIEEIRRTRSPAEEAIIRRFDLPLPCGVRQPPAPDGSGPSGSSGSAFAAALPAILGAVPPWVQGAIRVAGGVLLGYAVICLIMYFRQRSLVYHPGRTVDMTPADIGLPYEQLFLPVGGDRICAWFVPASAPSRGVMLVCHGNAGDIGDRIDTIRIFHDMGFDVLVFDYRGYGSSTGRPSEKTTYEDAQACWNYLVNDRGTAPERICVFGRSLGAAVAAWLAARQAPPRAPGAVVLESPFTSVPDLGKRLYPWLPVRRLARFRYPTIEYVRRLRCPVIVVHSVEDDLVPYAMGRRVYEAAPDPKAFVEIAGSHNEGFLQSGDRYVDGLLRTVEPFFSEPSAVEKDDPQRRDGGNNRRVDR